MIYLDSASTTDLSSIVLNEMMPFLTSNYGNPNSVHTMGTEARKAIDNARERVANSINADPKQIVFTSGGSEGNNMVIHGIRKRFPGISIVSSRTEHTSSVKSLEEENKYGGAISFIGENEFEDYSDAEWSTLLWRMYVNNEIGKVNDVYGIGEMCNGNNNLLFGTDCVQAMGFERIDVKEMQCDFLTISSHKIHGPKGVGALYVRDSDLIMPIINGGSNQEFGLRGGTENVAGIVGFGKACELAEFNREENKSKILYLRNLFIENINGMDYKINCEDESKILSIQLPEIDSETMVLMLSSVGVAISSGSACKSSESIPNWSLISYGLNENEARSTIRLSFSSTNTIEEVESAANLLKKVTRYYESTRCN